MRGGEDFNIAEQAVNIVVVAKLLSLVCWFLNVSGCTHNFVLVLMLYNMYAIVVWKFIIILFIVKNHTSL